MTTSAVSIWEFGLGQGTPGTGTSYDNGTWMVPTLVFSSSTLRKYEFQDGVTYLVPPNKTVAVYLLTTAASGSTNITCTLFGSTI
jgi:hypothetical protein